MAERGERVRFTGEASGKLRIHHALRREQLQRDEPVERFLPGLVHHAHAAATEAFEDFKLREVRRDLRRIERCGRRFLGLGGMKGAGHETARAQSAHSFREARTASGALRQRLGFVAHFQCMTRRGE